MGMRREILILVVCGSGAVWSVAFARYPWAFVMFAVAAAAAVRLFRNARRHDNGHRDAGSPSSTNGAQ